MKNLQKGSTTFIIIAIVGLIVVIVGGYMYQNKNEPVINTITEQNVPVSQSTSVNTSTWKVYEDTYYGIKFKYSGTVKAGNTNRKELSVSFIEPFFDIAIEMNSAVGFAGWIDYRAKDQIRSFDMPATISYLKAETPNDYLFMTLIKPETGSFLITARTNGSDLQRKEVAFKAFVESLDILVMP